MLNKKISTPSQLQWLINQLFTSLSHERGICRVQRMSLATCIKNLQTCREKNNVDFPAETWRSTRYARKLSFAQRAWSWLNATELCDSDCCRCEHGVTEPVVSRVIATKRLVGLAANGNAARNLCTKLLPGIIWYLVCYRGTLVDLCVLTDANDIPGFIDIAKVN